MGLFEEYDNIVKSVSSQQSGRLQTSLYTSADTNPDQEAGFVKLSQKTGIPVEALRNDNGAEARRRAAALPAEEDLQATAPKTAEFLADPANAKLAHDDLEALAKVEGIFSRMVETRGIASASDRQAARTAQSIGRAIGTGLSVAPELLNAGLAGTGRLAAEGVEWSLRGFEDPTGMRQRVADIAKESSDYWNAQAKVGLSPTDPGTLPYYLQEAAKSVGVSALAAPFGLAGEGSALSMFALSADDNYDELIKAGVSKPAAIALSLSGKSMEGLTEKIGLHRLYDGGKPLIKKMTGFLFGDLLGEEVNTLYSAVADKVTVKPDMTFADLGKQLVDTAIVTALAGPMQGAIFHGPASAATSLADGMQQAATAHRNQQVMQALGEASTESKLQTRLPEKFREFVAAVKQDGPVENAYIPADEWKTYWQEKNVDPQQMADQVTDDGGNQYMEALATGGDIVIPIEAYAERLAATEHHGDLSKHVRLRQGDMTLAEAEAFDKEREQRVQELVDQLKAEAETATVNRPSWLKVYDDLYGQLMGVFPRDTAERYATLGAIRARTRAERLGSDAFDLYNEQPLKIGRPLPEALRKRTVDTGIDPLLDRLRAADIPAEETIFGQSLLQFLRTKGVKDEGGELAAMDANAATRKPGQRNLVRVDGLSLDKAREAAAEAGYLKDDSTVADLLDAVDTELRGAAVYSTKPVNDQAFELKATLDQLQGELDRRGIDLAQMDNEAVRRQLFQGEQGGELYQGQRGFFRTSPLNTTREIGILENADLSTFIHELGHSWLEELKQDAERPDAPEQLKADWEAIKTWAGIEGDTIPVEAHELFARASESYVMEGNAPSAELQTVFQRFKAWLSRIYRELSGLNVKLTPEVRGVFDRMLATDDEITRARDSQNMRPIFATAEAAGMTAAEFAAYQKTAEEANAAESDRLEKKLLAELTREQKVWWKDQRDAMRLEVEAEAKQNPVYEALQVILKGEDFAGNKAEQSLKLDKATLVQMYGEQFLKRLPRGFGHIYTTEGGMHPDAVAEIFGFSSGDDMIRQMIEAPKMKAWVEAETDMRMRERHGDMLHDGSLADEALKSIHEGDQRAQVLAAELRAIRKKQRDAAPFVKAARQEAETDLERERREREYERRWMEAEKNLALAIEKGAAEEEVKRLKDAARAAKADEVQGRRTMQASIPPLKFFRDLAAATIAAKEVRSLEPHMYSQAEAKAAREAFDAAAKNDWAKAGDAKYRQMLNHFLYREAAAAKDETDRIRDYLTKMGEAKQLRKVGLAGQSFLHQIQGILERFDLARISSAQIDRNLQQFLDDIFEGTGLDIPLDELVIDGRRRKNWKELTVDEMRALNDSIRAIEHAARQINSIRRDAETLFIEDAEQELVERAELANEKELKQFLTHSSMSGLDKLTEGLRDWNDMILRPERLIEWLDGGETGPWHDLLWNKAVDADNKRNDLRGSLLPHLQALMENVTKDHSKRLREIYRIKELGVDMSISEMIGVALNVGNASNREKLQKGGVYVGADRRMIDDAALVEILDHLRQEEWQMVQGLWDAVDSLWPQIVELETRRSGLAPVKVDATPIVNEHGEFRGGYWPAVYDPRHSRQGEKQADANRTDQMFGANFSKASTRKGHVKERVQNFARPMNLDWQAVVSRHVDNVITDLSHWDFVFDVRRLLARDGVRKAVQTRIGETAFRSLEGWLKYTVQADYFGDPAAGAFQRARQLAVSNLAIAALGFKVATAAGNLVVAPVQAADRVAPKFLAQGIGEFMRNPRAAIDTAAALSGQMRHRIHEMDKSFQETLNNLAGRDSIRAKVARASMAVHMWVDRIGSTAIWWGAYREAQGKGIDGLDAVRHADKAIRMTQTAGAPKDLSAFERDPRYQELKLFLGPMLIMGNGIRSTFREHGVKATWKPEAWGKLFALWFGPAILFELAVGRGPDDDENWAAWGLRKLLLYPLQTIPFVRELANAIEGKLTGKRQNIRNLPVYEAGNAVVEAAARTYKALADDGDKEKAVKAVANASGLALGLPSGQATITGEFLYDVLSGGYEPEHPYSPLRDIFLKRKENH